jgi:hypothetical protein
MHPIQLSASFVRFEGGSYRGMRNLEFSGTKLFFNREPGAGALRLSLAESTDDGCAFR